MDVNHVDAFRTISEAEQANGLVIRWAGHYFRDKTSPLNRIHNRYYLLNVYQGRGYICNSQGETEAVGPGSIVLFKPGERQCLWADNDDPFSYYGTCFCGRVIDYYLQGSPVCQATHHPMHLDRRLVTMMDSFLNLMLLERGSHNDLLVVSKFFSILARVNVIISLSAEQALEKRPAETTLELVEQYMRINYNKPISNEVLAEVARYSITWLEQNFKAKYGLTPMQYLTQIRIKKAQQLLCMSEGETLNIAEIGFAVGYNDPLYFSKVFKKATNLSPKDYRALYQGGGGS